MDLQTVNLTPFWFTPAQDGVPEAEKVSFRLKPLTQPQIIELQTRTYERVSALISMPTTESFYVAGCMAIEGGGDIRNLTVDGKPARWVLHKDLIPREWVVECGLKVFNDAHGDVTDEEIEEVEKNLSSPSQS